MLPSPGRLATSTVPPCRATMPQTTASPRPLPCGPFVVKKGSKTRRAVSGDMPTPVSRTVTTALVPSVLSPKTRRPPRGHGLERVGEEIGEDLAQLLGPPGHPRDGAGLDVDLVGDASALRLVLPARPGHLDDLAHDVEELHPTERPGPARPGELLDAPHRLGAVERRLVDRLEAPGELRRLRAAQEQLRAPDDDGEEVVEVVGHAGRHLAQRAKLLGPDQMVLGERQLAVRRRALLVEPRAPERQRREARDVGRAGARRPP